MRDQSFPLINAKRSVCITDINNKQHIVIIREVAKLKSEKGERSKIETVNNQVSKNKREK